MNNEQLIFLIVKKANPYNQDKAWDWEDPAVEPRQEPFAPSSENFVQDMETVKRRFTCTNCGCVSDSNICPKCGSVNMAQV
jgi:hypothetical protein